MWDSGAWSQINTLDPDAMIAADFDGDHIAEAVADMGGMGIWTWNNSLWSQISANNPDSLIAANRDADAADEIAADLGTLGLWMWDGNTRDLGPDLDLRSRFFDRHRWRSQLRVKLGHVS